MQWLEFMDMHGQALTFISAIILVLVTMYYARQAKVQADEAKRQREIQTRPYVYADIGLGENKRAVILKVANTGQSVATNIVITFFPQLFSEIRLSSLAPAQTYSKFLGFSDNIRSSAKDFPSVIECNINHKGANEKTYFDNYSIYIGNLLSQSVSGGVAVTGVMLEEIEQGLNKISVGINDIASLLKERERLIDLKRGTSISGVPE